MNICLHSAGYNRTNTIQEQMIKHCAPAKVYFLRRLTLCKEGSMSKVLLVLKVLLVFCLIFLFLKYFGLKSFERYNSQKVFVTKSWKRPASLPSPAVTVCSSDLDSGHGVKNLSKEQMTDNEKSFLDYICAGKEEEELVQCTEESMFDLHNIVEFEGYDHGYMVESDTRQKMPLVESHWKMSLNSDKGSCLTFQDFQHFPTGDVLKIGMTKDLKHQVFFHDPKFFLKSENPDVPINNNILDPGDYELSRLVLVEHEMLDVPDKRCNPIQNYSLTNCVKEAFSQEVGCALHWDLENLSIDLPKCATIDQYR